MQTFSRILKFLGFVIVMVVSTWATVESIYRLLDLPRWLIWPIALLFFWTAAHGVSLVVRSFNYDERIDGRGKLLFGGLTIALLFWFGLILPTNTHTFFYKRVIKETCLTELKSTQSAIELLSAQGEALIEKEIRNLESKVNALISNFKSEIMDPNRPGYAQRAETVLSKIDELLGIKIQRLSPPRNNTFTQLNTYASSMEGNIRQQLDIRKKDFEKRIIQLEEKLDPKRQEQVINDLKSEQAKFVDEPTKSTKTVLIDAFALISQYSDILVQYIPAFERREVNTPETIDLENVFIVWSKFLSGEYSGRGFWYFVLAAALIDLAGFILYHSAVYQAFKD